MRSEAVAPYAPALIKLLQGIVYHDDPHWGLLLQHQAAIMEYFGRMGLEVYLDESEGFAYLQQPDAIEDDSQAIALPRLTRRDRLSYGVTLLLVLLREALLQFDASEPQGDRLVLTIEQLRDLQRPFYRERSDETRLIKTLDSAVNRVVELGFLKRLSGDDERYEVRRIIVAKIGADVLADIKAKLQHHAESDT
jgi:hypothetical protein